MLNLATEITEPPVSRLRSLEVILGLLPLVLGFEVFVWLVYVPTALRGNADFRNFYSAGLIVRLGQGHDLYDLQLQGQVQSNAVSKSSIVLPFVHLPYEALLYAPFSLLSYRSAFFAILGVNSFLLLACYRILKGHFWRLSQEWRWLPPLFFLGYIPVTAALIQGQDSLLTLLFLSSALINLESGKDLFAGFLIGLGVFKFQIALPIIFLFLVWKNWRFVSGACVSILLAVAVSVLVSGVRSIAPYLRALREVRLILPNGQALFVLPISRTPNLRGLVHSILPMHSELTANVVVLIASAAVIGLAAWAGHKSPARWQLAIAISATVLVGYHVLAHDLVMMLVPMAVLLEPQQGRGFWNIPGLWLSPMLCFLAQDYLVAVPMLVFFAFLAQRLVRVRTWLDNNILPACLNF